MKFFIHPNFPEATARALQLIDFQNEYEFFEETYPTGADDEEWIPCLGKQAIKPTILSADNSVLGNSVSKQVLVESGCSFVYVSRALRKKSLHEQTWKLIRVWPEVTTEIKTSTRNCAIEVSDRMKLHRTNL